MNLITRAQHTFDLDRLPEKPTIVDVGCRGFDFTRELLALRPNAHVIAFDPDVMIHTPIELRSVAFFNCAVVGSNTETWYYHSFSTGEANYVDHVEVGGRPVVGVELASIGDCDLLKLDCEGSEFEIFAHWPGNVAKQISVEFHDWDKPQIRDGDYYEKLFSTTLKDYEVLQHELSRQGEGTGHWDTVLALKETK